MRGEQGRGDERARNGNGWTIETVTRCRGLWAGTRQGGGEAKRATRDQRCSVSIHRSPSLRSASFDSLCPAFAQHLPSLQPAASATTGPLSTAFSHPTSLASPRLASHPHSSLLTPRIPSQTLPFSSFLYIPPHVLTLLCLFVFCTAYSSKYSSAQPSYLCSTPPPSAVCNNTQPPTQPIWRARPSSTSSWPSSPFPSHPRSSPLVQVSLRPLSLGDSCLTPPTRQHSRLLVPRGQGLPPWRH